ncbi:MAG: hypothetical protein WCL90_04665 [Planctomycetota bacterium]|nr:hypothetical protein [Gemmataceae bacterium]
MAIIVLKISFSLLILNSLIVWKKRGVATFFFIAVFLDGFFDYFKVA